MAETVVYTPESNQANTVPAWLAMQNGGFNGGLGSWGGGILGFLLGLWLGNGNGIGGIGGGNNANANAQREMLNNAILSQGEASRAAVQNLATMLGQDFNLVNSGVQTIQGAISSLALQQAVSVPQIVNAIQAGDASLASQLCQCCCENRLLTTEQGYQAQIRTIEQTNQLGSQADRNTASVIGAINSFHNDVTREFCEVREREMQDKINTQGDIITQLRNQIDNANQTAQVAAMLAPINSKLAEIENKQPNTVPVQWPNLYAVNATPYVSGGYYQGGYNGFYGPGYNGFGGFGGITF